MMSDDPVVGGAAGAGSDSEDEIVQRIPVFLSQELAHNLYLLQYPLRSKDRPYTDVGTFEDPCSALCCGPLPCHRHRDSFLTHPLRVPL
jgi:hypothetical protein